MNMYDKQKKTNARIHKESYKIRASYLYGLQLKGITVESVSKVWARVNDSMWLATPLATEAQANSWWLGLRRDKIIEKNSEGGVVIILLCQPDIGNLMDFVIPPHVVMELLPKLSRSKDQVEFNLKKKGEIYELNIPRNSPFDVTQFKSNVSFLTAAEQTESIVEGVTAIITTQIKEPELETKLVNDIDQKTKRKFGTEQTKGVQLRISCPKCHRQGIIGQHFCGYCGSTLTCYCAVCGTAIVSSYKFCINCGTKLG